MAEPPPGSFRAYASDEVSEKICLAVVPVVGSLGRSAFDVLLFRKPLSHTRDKRFSVQPEMPSRRVKIGKPRAAAVAETRGVWQTGPVCLGGAWSAYCGISSLGTRRECLPKTLKP